MFDCGEGTVRQMLNSSVRASKLDSVFITHLHGDHVSRMLMTCKRPLLMRQFYGLPGLAMRLIGLRSERDKTKLYAPYGLRTFLGTSISAYCAPLLHPRDSLTIFTSNRNMNLHEIVPGLSKRAGELAVNPVLFDSASGVYNLTSNELFSIKAVPIKHSVFCLGYIIEEMEQRGR